MTEKNDDLEFTLTQAADYCHVCRQAIYKAIQIGRLEAYKRNKHWFIKVKDLDTYRATKYRRDLKVVDGERVFDLEKGHYSVLHVCKIFSEMMKCHYPPNKLYYLIRTGRVPAMRKGGQYVIKKDDAIELFNRELNDDPRQQRFA